MSDSAWIEAVARHRRSVEVFVAAAEAIADSDWERPLGADQWSPAQVAEHLRLSYQVGSRELAGGTGLRLRTSWWQRLLLRWRFLPRILAEGRIPAKARAPSELRPAAGPFPRPAVLAALTAGATAVEGALTARHADRAAGMTHHVFGRLSPAEALRFLTVHNGHHTAQLVRSAGPAAG